MFNKFIKTFFITLFIATGVLAQTLITDNMGNHRAIKPLDMNNFSIQNISTNAFYFNDGSSLTIDGNQQIVVKNLSGTVMFDSGNLDTSSISSGDSTNIVYDTGTGTNTIVIDGSPRVHITANGIIPEGNEVFDLGTAENKFRDLYLSASTIYLGDNKISYNADASSLTVVSSDNVTNTFLNDGYVFPENSDFAGALTNATLKTGTVGSDQLGEQSVGNYNILNKSITLDKLVDSVFERDVRKSSGSLINRGLWGAYIIGAGSEINGFPPTQSDNNRVLKYNHSSGSSTGYWTLVTLDSLTLDPDAMLKSEYDNRAPLHGTNGIVDYAEGLKNTTNYYDLGTVKWYKPANTNDGQVPVYSHTDGELRWINLAGGGDMLKDVYDVNDTNAPYYPKIPNVVDVAETFINWPYSSTNKINVVKPQVGGDDSGKFLRFYWNSAANTYTTGLEEISTTLSDPEGSVVMLKANYLDQADKILLEKIPDGYLGSKIASKTITSNQIANNTLVSTNFNPEFLNTMIFKDTSFGKDESGPDSDLVGNHISGIRVVGLSGKDLPIPTENDANKVLAYDALNQNWKLAAVDIEGGGAATVPYPSNAFPTDGNGEPVQSIIGSLDGVNILWYTNFASSGGGSGGISSLEPEIIHAQIFARNDADPQAPGLNFKQHDSYTVGSTNGTFIKYEGENRINMTSGMLFSNNNLTANWLDRYLTGGPWRVYNTINPEDENNIVNYKILTNFYQKSAVSNFSPRVVQSLTLSSDAINLNSIQIPIRNKLGPGTDIDRGEYFYFRVPINTAISDIVITGVDPSPGAHTFNLLTQTQSTYRWITNSVGEYIWDDFMQDGVIETTDILSGYETVILYWISNREEDETAYINYPINPTYKFVNYILTPWDGFLSQFTSLLFLGKYSPTFPNATISNDLSANKIVTTEYHITKDGNVKGRIVGTDNGLAIELWDSINEEWVQQVTWEL